MHILINALRLQEGKHRHLGGNYYHVEHLVRALVANPKVRVSALCDEFSRPGFLEILPSGSTIKVGLNGGGVLAADIQTMRIVRRLRPDVYHRPTGQLPFLPLPVATVASIADINFRVLPMRWGKRLYKELSYRWTLKVADRVTCVSEFTRQEVLKHFKVESRKLSVIPHGTNIFPTADQEFASQIDGPFWLTFGHQAHKNVELIIRAVKLLANDRLPPRILVVGASQHIDEVLVPMVMAEGVQNLFIFAGRLTDAQLAGCYARARGLLFVSKYEGFGLPILEAMGAGIPVICAPNASIPEVAGQACIYVNDDEPVALAEAIRRLDSDEALRKELIEKGASHAREFGWQQAAEQTIEVYRQAIQTHNKRKRECQKQ